MADLKFVHVGLGDVVCANHVIAVIQYGPVFPPRS